MFNRKLRSDILFSGYYGQSNAGDDAFVEVASWGASKYWGKSNNIFLAREVLLPKVRCEIRGYPYSIPRSYLLQRRLLLPFTKYVVSAGGSTLNREISLNDIKALASKRKSNGGDVKLGGIGVSIGPFKTSKDEISIVKYLKQLDFLAVRDQASYDFASSLDLPYKTINAFDLAALLPNIYGVPTFNSDEKQKKVLGVSVCPYESIVNPKEIDNENDRNDKVVHLLKHLESIDDIHIKFFIINGKSNIGDIELTKETIARVSPKSFEIVPYTKETQVIWNEIASCDFFLATRLHAAIFSCFCNIPFMLNEYHRKCGDFLDNIGYKECYRLYNNEYDPIEKANTISSILRGNTEYVPPQFTHQMMQRAELNFKGIVL